MPKTTRKERKDLQMLETAILQFIVSTFDRNLTIFIYGYVHKCSNLIHLSKENVNKSNPFKVKVKKPQSICLLQCHQNFRLLYWIYFRILYNYCNLCCHLCYTFLFLFNLWGKKLRELEWDDQIPPRNSRLLSPFDTLHIPVLENLFRFLSFLQATNHGHLDNFHPSIPK